MPCHKTRSCVETWGRVFGCIESPIESLCPESPAIDTAPIPPRSDWLQYATSCAVFRSSTALSAHPGINTHRTSDLVAGAESHLRPEHMSNVGVMVGRDGKIYGREKLEIHGFARWCAAWVGVMWYVFSCYLILVRELSAH